MKDEGDGWGLLLYEILVTIFKLAWGAIRTFILFVAIVLFRSGK